MDTAKSTTKHWVCMLLGHWHVFLCFQHHYVFTILRHYNLYLTLECLKGVRRQNSQHFYRPPLMLVSSSHILDTSSYYSVNVLLPCLDLFIKWWYVEIKEWPTLTRSCMSLSIIIRNPRTICLNLRHYLLQNYK